MAPTIHFSKAQGSTEYLVTLGVVLIIVLISIVLLTWPIGATKDAKRQQTDVRFKIGEIGAQVNDDRFQSITQGLVAYYKFEDGSGTSATDSRGGYAGTLANGPTWASGKSGEAVSFDGIDDAISTASQFLPSSDLTISAWIYPTGSSGSGLGKIITDSQTGGSGIAFSYFSGTKRVGFSNTGDLSSCGSTSSNSVPFNTWSNVVVTRSVAGSNSTINFYLNGSLSASYTCTAPTAANANVRIGNRQDGSYGFNGTIDEILIFNRALSASEIRLLYENPGYPQ